MFEIIGRYLNGEIEVIDTCDNEQEAYRLLGEYELAFLGSGFRIDLLRR